MKNSQKNNLVYIKNVVMARAKQYCAVKGIT